MSLKHIWIAGLLMIIISGSVSAVCQATISYNASTDLITVQNGGDGSWDWNCVITDVANTTVVSWVSPSIVLLNANITASGVSTHFYQNSSNVTELRLNSTDTKTIVFEINGQGDATNTKFISWNTTTQSEEIKSLVSTPRSYILVNGSSSKLNLTTVNMSYLGYNVQYKTGISYRDSINNNITNSTFTYNYNGIYIRGNTNNFSNNHDINYNNNDGVSIAAKTGNIIQNNINISNNLNNGIILNGADHSITINNINISYNGVNGILSYFGGGFNNISNNSYIYNNSQYGIKTTNETNNIISSNWEISNNTNDGIYLRTSNSTIDNNHEIYNNTGSGITSIIETNRSIFNNYNIYNNTIGIYGGGNINISNNSNINMNTYGIHIEGSNGLIENNFEIHNNNVSGIRIYNASNITAYNNSVYFEDQGFLIYNSNNITINFSSIVNMTRDSDGYNVGICLCINNSNIIIKNNNISQVGMVGILGWRYNNNITLTNNSIDFLSIDYIYNSTTVNTRNEPRSAFMFSLEFASYILPFTDNIDHANFTQLNLYRPNNITLLNNTITGTDLILYTQSVDNLTHDFNNYMLWSYNFTRLTGKNDLYIKNNAGNLLSNIMDTNRTVFYGNTSITDKLRVMYEHEYLTHGKEFFFDYYLSSRALKIVPTGWEKYVNNTVYNMTDIPFDFYLYSPAYTPFFGSNKSNTIYSNGTNYIQLYNDTLEQNGYQTINASIIPSSNSLMVNITTWNTTGDYYKKLNITSNATITAGDFPRNSKMQIKLNGSNYATVQANSTGYFRWVYSGGAGESQLEFEVMRGTTNFPLVAVEVTLGTAATIALYTYYRRRGRGGRIYGFMPFL